MFENIKYDMIKRTILAPSVLYDKYIVQSMQTEKWVMRMEGYQMMGAMEIRLPQTCCSNNKLGHERNYY